MQVAAEHATECGRLVVLHREVAEAQDTHAKLELESPLTPQGASYADLSSELMKELEGGTKKVDVIVEEECRDLFFVVATRVFSHLLLRDPSFKFKEVMGPEP
ncbi:hypothetical protein D1007_33947 [Hordeum vulgare]|nr:hypothetical protein D1007_33947 [Hordeum vulgare]